MDLSESASRQILVRFQRIQGLAEASTSEIAELTGLDSFEILRTQALIELGRRISMAGKGNVQCIESPDDVYDLLEYLRFEKKEHFVAILLDSKNQILRVASIHVGTLNMSIVGPREVFREAIRDGAASIIVAHNHPSGDPRPSPEDIDVTNRLVKVGLTLDIPVVDHVIIGDRASYSFNAHKLL